MNGYIYLITNTINGMQYIGQTVNPEARWKKHLSVARGSYYYRSYFYNAINKYGPDNFTFEVVLECDAEALEEKEQEYIAKYNTLYPNGYNLTPGGKKLYKENNPFYKRQHSEETKLKISLKNRGRKHTSEWKEKASERNAGENNPYYGKKHSEEIRSKMRDSFTYERRQAISERMKANNPNKDGDFFKKRVVMLDKNTLEPILEFDSAHDAGEYCRAQGLTKAKYPGNSIGDVCRGIQKTAFGYKFKYIEEGVSTIES